ncbi:Na/Pi cotransporter family protein [Moraxella equi]|uniref:Na/Pi-cotransporter II-related protein n=2 Tax=Moraxella equi TaxID=60442 RepID=A0A378QQ88_9GAMM|nr:Na/Pi symporter [Moraxella equi]STZ02642.1 Na/Pi-cotransporter II-related protein [Moraxella equi]
MPHTNHEVSIMKRKNCLHHLMLVVFAVGLGLSFWYSSAWLHLCYGLALFLFGMQCIEEGLHSTAGGTLEKLMTKSTATPAKGFLFGVGSTFILQSSTLVSLLTIAFLGTGMITLAGGIAIIFGTNLGATTGIWLLALAGQSVSLSPVAIPMLVFGILLGFFGGQPKAVGRILVGVALIFMGIDAIKSGFGAFGGQLDFASLNFSPTLEVLTFAGIGFLLTCVLQSSHATLILTLTALASTQITIPQAFAIAVGSNLGSSATTAIMGMISSERAGQRLALAHLIFNGVTAILTFVLWMPMTTMVDAIAKLANFPPLIQLALFHTLFNVFGIAVFWRWQGNLANVLTKILPDKANTKLLPDGSQAVMPRHLDPNALMSADIALRAVSQEIRHLASLSMEVMSHAVFVPSDDIYKKDESPTAPTPPFEPNVQTLYEWQIKPLYGEILDFVSKMDVDETDTRQDELTAIHLVAFTLLGMVKDAKHLQKNMAKFLAVDVNNDKKDGDINDIGKEYRYLREHLFVSLQALAKAGEMKLGSQKWVMHIDMLIRHADGLDDMRGQVFACLRDGVLDGEQASSLMNDISYVKRIEDGVLELLMGAGEMFCCQAR